MKFLPLTLLLFSIFQGVLSGGWNPREGAKLDGAWLHLSIGQVALWDPPALGQGEYRWVQVPLSGDRSFSSNLRMDKVVFTWKFQPQGEGLGQGWTSRLEKRGPDGQLIYEKEKPTVLKSGPVVVAWRVDAHGVEVALEGEVLHRFERGSAGGKLSIELRGRLKAAAPRAVKKSESLPLLDASSLEGLVSFPSGWTARSGVWSPLNWIDEQGWVMMQSAQDGGVLDFDGTVPHGGHLSGRVRLEVGGSVGLGFNDPESGTVRSVWLREHKAHGLLVEEWSEGTSTPLQRVGASIKAGIWYDLKSERRGGEVVVHLDGRKLPIRFKALHHLRPALMARGTCLFRHVVVSEGPCSLGSSFGWSSRSRQSVGLWELGGRNELVGR